MINIDTSQKISTDREPLFSIDGVEYTMPREVSASLTLEAMERFETLGEIRATRWLMVELLGQEGYDALRRCKEVTVRQFLQIQEVLRDRALGTQEGSGKD